MKCTMNVVSREKSVTGGNMEKKIEFSIKIYQSRKWKNIYVENNKSDAKRVLAVRLERKGGDIATWMKIKKDFLLKYCSLILKGLPRWKNQDENNFYDEYEIEDDKDYRDILLKSL